MWNECLLNMADLYASDFACVSRYICYMTCMARGESGRIVIEVDPEVKRQLYAALALSGSTLKDWFIKSAAIFCEESVQPSLFQKGGERREVDQVSPSSESADSTLGDNQSVSNKS